MASIRPVVVSRHESAAWVTKDRVKTFPTKAEAAAWARLAERGAVPVTAQTLDASPLHQSITLREAQHRYFRE